MICYHLKDPYSDFSRVSQNWNNFLKLTDYRYQQAAVLKDANAKPASSTLQVKRIFHFPICYLLKP